jgi:three-Cys-motif partner protein
VDRAGKGGATYIDPFCGPGRCRVRDSGEWIDGGVVAAWKKSSEGGAPFTQVYIGDLDAQRREAASNRLRQLGAPVVEIDGAATQSVQQIVAKLDPYGLHFAFLDPFNLEALDFGIFEKTPLDQLVTNMETQMSEPKNDNQLNLFN